MAKIQVDFDQVMHFGDLHRDLARALDGHRSAFNLDGNRLDQIINEFALPRSTSNPHFSGQTIAWSIQDGSDRARRVADSMLKTSTRIFSQANPIVDDHFDWGHVFNSANLAAPISALAEWAGGQLVDAIVVAGRYGVLATPAFVVVAPVFFLVTGGLAVYEGAQQVLDVAADAWDRVSGGLKVLAGGASIVVGGVVGATLVMAGTGTAAATAILLAPVLAVAGVVGVVALGIDHRHEIGNLLGFGNTNIESSGSQLAAPPQTWTVRLAPGAGPTIIATFPDSSLVPTGGLAILRSGPGVVLRGPSSAPSHGVPADTPPQPVVVTLPPGSVGAPTGLLQPPSGGVEGYREAAGLYPRDAWYTKGSPANGFSDRWGKAAWNCTSWVAYRRNQLSLSVPDGNGGAMGHNANASPTLGAVVSYGAGTEKDFGHVMLVEEILSPTEFRVSEMNFDNNGGFRESLVWTKQGDGTWQSSLSKTTKTLKFTP